MVNGRRVHLFVEERKKESKRMAGCVGVKERCINQSFLFFLLSVRTD